MCVPVISVLPQLQLSTQYLLGHTWPDSERFSSMGSTMLNFVKGEHRRETAGERGLLCLVSECCILYFCSTCSVGQWCTVSRDIWCNIVPAVYPECTVSWWPCTPVQTLWPPWCDFPKCVFQTACEQRYRPFSVHLLSSLHFQNPEGGFLFAWWCWTISGLGNPADFSIIHWIQPDLLQWGLNPAMFEPLFQFGPSLGILSQLYYPL